MSRPEQVRCGTCVYWMKVPYVDDAGNCRIRADSPLDTLWNKTAFCGQWQGEWPTPLPERPPGVDLTDDAVVDLKDGRVTMDRISMDDFTGREKGGGDVPTA